MPSRSTASRLVLLLLATLPLLALGSCSSHESPATTVAAAPSLWVASWGAPPENALVSAADPGGAEQSFRFIVLPTIDGTQERVHFSNAYGSTPITLGSARIAVAGTGAAVDASTDKALTFSESPSVTIPAGGQIVSDPVSVSYTYGQSLAVSVYIKGAFPALTQHDSQVSQNYYSAAGAGDTTTDTTGTDFPNSVNEWFLLSGVDVYGTYQGTVVLFGSSSIDGHNSNFGTTNAYPVANVPVAGQDNDRPADWLGRTLIAAGYRIGVLNAGTIGDPAGEDASTEAGNAAAGVDRFSRDVIQQANVKAVVVYIGGVDLRSDCVPATNVEVSLTNIIAQAQAAGIRVILATIPPAEYCLRSDASLLPSTANPWQGDLYPGPENPGSTQRRLLNAWIRTSGSKLPGVVAIADFDAVLMYPTHPDFLIPIYTTDNFHPTGLGYGLQNSAIPLSSLLGQ